MLPSVQGPILTKGFPECPRIIVGANGPRMAELAGTYADAVNFHSWERDLPALIGIARTPTQVRNHGDRGVQTTRGAFLRSDLPIAGFAVIEARDLDEAVALVAKAPCAVADGVVEVWPLDEMT